MFEPYVRRFQQALDLSHGQQLRSWPFESFLAPEGLLRSAWAPPWMWWKEAAGGGRLINNSVKKTVGNDRCLRSHGWLRCGLGRDNDIVDTAATTVFTAGRELQISPREVPGIHGPPCLVRCVCVCVRVCATFEV